MDNNGFALFYRRHHQRLSLSCIILAGLFWLGCTPPKTPQPVSTPTDSPPTPEPASTDPPPTPEPAPTDPPPAAVSTDNEADADVLFVSARKTGENSWSFSVTVAHPDTGWDDYADGWDVVLPDGTAVLPNENHPFTRLLLHPHENEQPFTRSQSNIIIPADVTQITVRAHDIVHGFGGQEVVVDLTAVSGPNFEIDP